MKALVNLLLFGGFALLGSGCTMIRHVELEVPRIETEAVLGNQLTPAAAERLFRDVSARFGCSTQGPFSGVPGAEETLFTASPKVRRPGNNVRLTLDIEKTRTRFYFTVEGTEAEFVTAQEIAAEFKRELQHREIEFRESLITRHPFWGP